MRNRDLLGSLVIAAAVVLALALAAGFVLGGEAGEPRPNATVDKPYYTSGDVVDSAELVEGSGSIDVTSGQKTVLIKHTGPESSIEPVTRALVEAGHEVRFYRPGQGGGGFGDASPLNRSLAEADAFLVIGANGFRPADIDGIEAFAEAGGRVFLAHDATPAMPAVAGLPVQAPVPAAGPGASELLSTFGVDVGEGYLYDMAENDENFQRVFASAEAGQLARGVDRLVVDTASPVFAAEASPVVSTGDGTHYSLTREAGSYTVAARSGNAVVLGDTAMFSELNHDRADNNVFLGNVLSFLTSGQKTPGDAPMNRDGGPGGIGGPTRPPGQSPPTPSGGSAP